MAHLPVYYTGRCACLGDELFITTMGMSNMYIVLYSWFMGMLDLRNCLMMMAKYM